MSAHRTAAVALARRLSAGGASVLLSGAGMSAESGIATFRSGPDALWKNFRPEDLATPSAFARDPVLVWEWYRHRLLGARDARPNPGHLAIAEIARRGVDLKVVTQNVDGLHQEAGSTGVIELHGNVRRARCLACAASAPTPLEGELPPRCRCGGVLRPDVVWFGELLPTEALTRSEEIASHSDVFVVAGTSAVVYPAAGLVALAKSGGAFVVEINPEETAVSAVCDLTVRARTGEFLPLVVEALRLRSR